TASLTVSLSAYLCNSLKACLRFLSADSWAWLRRSHVLSLSTVDLIEPESVLPEASLFSPPMTVASPMSDMATEVGRPTLLFSSFSSLEKDLHSGPASAIFSLRTKPQLLQNSSPPEESIIIGLWAHLGHLSRAFSSFISLEKLG